MGESEEQLLLQETSGTKSPEKSAEFEAPVDWNPKLCLPSLVIRYYRPLLYVRVTPHKTATGTKDSHKFHSRNTYKSSEKNNFPKRCILSPRHTRVLAPTLQKKEGGKKGHLTSKIADMLN